MKKEMEQQVCERVDCYFYPLYKMINKSKFFCVFVFRNVAINCYFVFVFVLFFYDQQYALYYHFFNKAEMFFLKFPL